MKKNLATCIPYLGECNTRKKSENVDTSRKVQTNWFFGRSLLMLIYIYSTFFGDNQLF